MRESDESVPGVGGRSKRGKTGSLFYCEVPVKLEKRGL